MTAYYSTVSGSTREQFAALRAEAEAAAAADPVARHEMAYVTPEYIERAATTRRNHDAQLLELGPAARAAHGASCPLCIERMAAVPGPVEEGRSGSRGSRGWADHWRSDRVRSAVRSTATPARRTVLHIPRV